MGCAHSCLETTMSLFRRRHSSTDNEERAKLEWKLYIAKESPESDFDLSDCQIRRIPNGVFPLCKVYRKKQLYLQNNILDSLEDGGLLSDLYLIEILNISHNRFTKIPDDIKYLVSLTELYLQDNLITVLPDGVQYLENLKMLDCSNNRIRKLTPLLGKLKKLKALNVKGNSDLTELCPELCFASNLISIELDCENVTFPDKDITVLGTTAIIKFLCGEMNIQYCPPIEEDVPDLPVQSPTCINNPLTKQSVFTWEDLEAVSTQQENIMHETSKLQREKMLTKVLKEQLSLDLEIAKVHEAKEIERQKLIKAIQANEIEIDCLVKNFIQSDFLKPEIIQQQLIHEQVEHDRLLEISRQNYDNIKKSDVLRAMKILIEEDCGIQHSKKQYENSQMDVKQSMLMQELENLENIQDFLKAKDESRSILVQQLLEDQNIQKAVVASLVERVDARSWSLNEEISLITSHLAKLSVIEQEKKKMHVMYNYNELLQQRVHLVTLLDDLLDQKNKRRKQLTDTLKEIENQRDSTTDFWLKNYQKLLDSAPKILLNIGKHLDPVLANYLLQEGVIHCLPFLVKFLFSGESLLNISSEELKENGVLLSSDRESILKAINYYFETICEKQKMKSDNPLCQEPSAPAKDILEEQPTGVVSSDEVNNSVLESECVICMDDKCEVVFVPCGHMCCCNQCASQEMASCPMCRRDIERKIKVMLA